MAKGKRGIRLIVSILLGFVFGIVCWLGTRYGALRTVNVDMAMAVGIIFNRALIGFCIGISGLKKLNFLLHGVIIGLVVTLPLSIYPFLGGDLLAFILLELAGAIYGLLIELIVVRVFKAPID